MKIKKLKVRDGEWCEVTVELRERNGKQELSITGAAGYVSGKRDAKRQAREFWESFFEDDPAQIVDMNYRCGTNFRSPRSAARYVLATDGELHGTEVHGEHGSKLLIGTSWGQIREEIAEYFPRVASLFRWHMNGMKAGCVHQHLQGKTYATHPGHECPSCGTKLGSAWYHWPLPVSVLDRIEALA